MALGILEPRVEHVPGTVYVYHAEQRQVELLATAQHLKRDKTGKVILVPQPSNDPNDPLVSLCASLPTSSTLILAELASLAARSDPRCPLFRLVPCDYGVSFARGGFDDTCNSLQAHISGCGAFDGVPLMRRGCGRMAVRRIGKSLGQKTSLSLWSATHGRQLGMGWFDIQES